MNIVLVGGSGFVGRHLVPRLASAGHSCTVLTRYPPSCRDIAMTPGTRIKACNVHDPDQLKAAFEGADAAISMAGILNESGRKGRGFRQVHVSLTRNVIDACKANDIDRLLHVSALNAGAGDSHYLVSKGDAEGLVRNAESIRYTIVQPSVIFGIGDSFFNRFAGLLRIAPVLPLACPESRMQPVWVEDVAHAMTLSLDDPESMNSSLIMVGPQDYSLRELVQFTARTMGRKRWIMGLPNPLSRVQAAVMDFVPGKPFSSDNYRSLQTDNVSVENSLWRFGIEPASIESIVPAYLDGSIHQEKLARYRTRSG